MHSSAVPINRTRRQIMSVLWMLIGAGLVFALLVVMNEYIETPKQDGQGKVTSMTVARPKPKKKPRKHRVKRTRPRKTTANARPPAPRLTAGLSGLAVGLPGFDASDLSGVSEGLSGEMKDMIMTEDSVDQPPRATERTPISYPPRARQKGISGYVTLSLLIDATGAVERVKVLEAEPPGVFEESALEAVRAWRFDPATYQGRAVKVWARQTLRFDLR